MDLLFVFSSHVSIALPLHKNQSIAEIGDPD